MLSGEMIGLRAIGDADIEVFEAELMNDAETRMRSDARPFRPVAPGSAQSPYRTRDDRPDAVSFAAAELATGELVGEAILWGIDLHNRHAHLGLTLRSAFRGKGMGTDIVRVLCRYGFAVRGLHRLQVDTLADNHAMIGAATRAGFVLEGNQRQAAWVNGSFADEVILGQLAPEWTVSDTSRNADHY
jgi:RimJ/RimL family protein N-acetyltransferase